MFYKATAITSLLFYAAERGELPQRLLPPTTNAFLVALIACFIVTCVTLYWLEGVLGLKQKSFYLKLRSDQGVARWLDLVLIAAAVLCLLYALAYRTVTPYLIGMVVGCIAGALESLQQGPSIHVQLNRRYQLSESPNVSNMPRP